MKAAATSFWLSNPLPIKISSSSFVFFPLRSFSLKMFWIIYSLFVFSSFVFSYSPQICTRQLLFSLSLLKSLYPISWIISNLSSFVTKWNLTLSHFLKYLTYRNTIDCSNLSLWHDYKIFQKLVLASVALSFSPHHNITSGLWVLYLSTGLTADYYTSTFV